MLKVFKLLEGSRPHRREILEDIARIQQSAGADQARGENRRLICADGPGDCLAPLIPSGAVTWFDPALPARPGDFVLIRIETPEVAHVIKCWQPTVLANGEAVVGLTSPNFPPLRFNPKTAQVAGRLVAYAVVPELAIDRELEASHNAENEQARREYRAQYGEQVNFQ